MLGDDLWDKFAVRLSDRIGQLIESRLRSFIEKYCRSAVKIIFSETEAASHFGVSKETLQCWRKRNLIGYVRLPQAKKDELSDMYVYTIVDLMEFTEKYRVKVAGRQNVYQFSPNVSPFGATVEQAKAA